MNQNAMILLGLLAASLTAQDPAAAARKYAAGDFAGAAAEYQRALEASPGTPEWLYDQALAAFRAGDHDTAVDAIERYAAAPGGGRADLHHGLLGNVRYAEAKALQQKAQAPAAPVAPDAAPSVDPVAVLEEAVQKATAARDAYVRAASAPEASPAIARNGERAARLLRDLQQALEEAKKRREQQKQEQQGDSKSEDEKNDEKKDEQKGDEQKPDESKPEPKKDDKESEQKDPGQPKPEPDEPKEDPQAGEPKPEPKTGEEKPEPKPGEEKPDEPKAGEPESKPKAGDGKQEPGEGEPKTPPPDSDPTGEPEAGGEKPSSGNGDESAQSKPEGAGEATPPGQGARADAPGEQVQVTELTPEQRQRLLDLLQKQDARLKQIRAATPRGARPVERDW